MLRTIFFRTTPIINRESWIRNPRHTPPQMINVRPVSTEDNFPDAFFFEQPRHFKERRLLDREEITVRCLSCSSHDVFVMQWNMHFEKSVSCVPKSPYSMNKELLAGRLAVVPKGGVHIMGKICPRSDPDIAHMRYYLGPLKMRVCTLLLETRSRSRSFSPISYRLA